MQARNVATVLERLRQANHRGALQGFWLHPVLTAALQTAIIMLKKFFGGGGYLNSGTLNTGNLFHLEEYTI